MAFKINQLEQQALNGLPHIQQLLYLLALRPYMDFATGIVGLKRKICYQSIAETLYVDPHVGYVNSGSPHRQTIRRSIVGLVRDGLLVNQSRQKHLIFYCPLASQESCVQNKPDTNPTHEPDTQNTWKNNEKTKDYNDDTLQPDRPISPQPGTPPVSGILLKKTTCARVDPFQSISWAYEPSCQILAQAAQLRCTSATAAREPLERMKFISYHLARGTQRCDWDAEYLGWLLRSGDQDYSRKEKTVDSAATSSQAKTASSQMTSSSVRISVGGAMDRVLEANRDLLDFFNNTGKSS